MILSISIVNLRDECNVAAENSLLCICREIWSAFYTIANDFLYLEGKMSFITSSHIVLS